MSGRKKFNVEVSVAGNADKSLRQVRKKMEREGIMRHIKKAAFFEPPTQLRRKKAYESYQKQCYEKL